MNKQKKSFISGLVGNSLDHYDMALYGFLAIYIAPSFFPNSDPVVAIIQTYLVSFIGLVTRPLGAIFFGRLAMTQGAKKSLMITLFGVAFTTGFIAMIPGYNKIGVFAPILLISTRAAQGFFAAGEITVSSMFVMDNVSPKNYSIASSIYNFSTMTGTIIASFTVYLISKTENPELYWRVAFLLGFLTGLVAIYLRKIAIEHKKSRVIEINLKDIFVLCYKNSKSLIKIIFITILSYVTYTIPFVFMNKFIPQITNISFEEMIKLNTILLVLNTILIPIVGKIIQNMDKNKVMGIVSLILAIVVIPLFSFLDGASDDYVTFVRMVIVVLGVIFVSPIYAWFFSQFKGDERYLLTGIGYQIGSETLGRNSTAICLSLWYYTGSAAAPAIFVAIIAMISSMILLFEKKSSHDNNYSSI